MKILYYDINGNVKCVHGTLSQSNVIQVNIDDEHLIFAIFNDANLIAISTTFTNVEGGPSEITCSEIYLMNNPPVERCRFQRQTYSSPGTRVIQTNGVFVNPLGSGGGNTQEPVVVPTFQNYSVYDNLQQLLGVGGYLSSGVYLTHIGENFFVRDGQNETHITDNTTDLEIFTSVEAGDVIFTNLSRQESYRLIKESVIDQSFALYFQWLRFSKNDSWFADTGSSATNQTRGNAILYEGYVEAYRCAGAVENQPRSGAYMGFKVEQLEYQAPNLA